MSKELSSLELNIEQTRERLASNIDQLVYRANPKTIVGRQVDSTKAHFVDPSTGQARTDNIVKVAVGVVGVIVVFAIIRKIAS